jgi:hypothetical protein
LKPHFLSIASIFFIALRCVPCAAQVTSGGEVDVTVREERTATPIALTKVTLVSSSVRIGYTDSDGEVIFRQVEAGSYTGTATAHGYLSASITKFDVTDGQRVNVRIELPKLSSSLHTIAKVMVSRPAGTGTRINASDYQLIAAPRLSDALLQAPEISQGFSGFGRSNGLSILGGSGTGFSLDGIPLNAPGVGPSFDPDLFSAVNVSPSASGGALGGTINFSGYSPTIQWQGQQSLSYGSFDSSSAIENVRGTIGQVGVAIVHADRVDAVSGNGQRYEDTSGLDYIHADTADEDGTYIRIRDAINRSNILNATLLGDNDTAHSFCSLFTAQLPCGYGPNNGITTAGRSFALRDDATIGEIAVSGSLFDSSQTTDNDAMNAHFYGQADPSSAIVDTKTVGYNVNATAYAKSNKLSLSDFFESSNFLFSGFSPPSPGLYTSRATSSYSSIQAEDRYNVRPSLELYGSVGTNSATGSSSALSLSGGLLWMRGNNEFGIGSNRGSVGAAVPAAETATPADDLIFDCNAKAAFGDAQIGLLNTGQRNSLSAFASTKIGASSVSASLSQSELLDGTLMSILPLENLSSESLSPQYLSEIQNAYSSAAACGSSAQLQAGRVFFSTPVVVEKQTRSSAVLRAKIPLSKTLLLNPYYVVQHAYVSAAGGSGSNPNGIIIPGVQIAGIPLHRAGVSIDFQPSSTLEAAINELYVGNNNSQNIPAYWLTSGGLEFKGSNGNLIASVSNIFNTEASRFDTAFGSVPLTTLGGGQIPTIAFHNAPRAFNIRYVAAVGRGATVQQVLQTSQDQQSEDATNFSLTIASLPKTPPQDAFDLQTTSPSCFPENRAQATKIFSAIEAYQKHIESLGSGGAYPAAIPAMPSVEGVSATYKRWLDTYAIELHLPTIPNGLTAQQLSILGCGNIHGAPGDLAALERAGAYIPNDAVPSNVYLLFQPSLGLYAVLNVNSSQVEEAKLFPLKAPRPENPLAVDRSHGCPPEYLPLANHLLSTLYGYVSKLETLHHVANGVAPDGWRVSNLASSKSGFSLDLDLVDSTALPVLIDCAHITGGFAEDFAGLGVARSPGLHYAPNVGLYLVQARQ